MKRRIVILVLALIATLGSAAEPLRVSASFSILADLVRAVGGERVVVESIVGPNEDAHVFQPKVSDHIRLADARLLFMNGLGFEAWLEGFLAASETKAEVVVVTEGIEPRTIDEGGVEVPDPHVWQDPRLVQGMIRRIRNALIAADSEGAAHYRERAELYLAELESLDDGIRREVTRIPADRRKLFTSHDALSYFAVRYGFEVVGTTYLSPAHEAADLSAQRYASLLAAIRDSGVPAVFAENIHPSAMTDGLGRDMGVRVVDTLYTDALGAPGTPGDTYLGMMRFNAKAIADALSAPAAP